MIKRILHTSDLHTGRRLKDRDRFDEFRKFFTWLEEVIRTENIDALLISGDIFDSTTPSVEAQDIYYSFLGNIAKSSCRHTVIISGNHDSPALIDAPSELLELCSIHVVGRASENPGDEVITLYDSDGKAEMIACAVPYLRERDVRRVDFDDNTEDISSAIKSGIYGHYEKVFDYAEKLRGTSDIPIIAMGHLFAQKGTSSPEEGIRPLYVGTAVEISSGIFPEFITYTALGHLHSAQKAGGRENIRYSGSPIAMTFGELGQAKSVYVLELEGRDLKDIKAVEVPVFQRLERISGDMTQIVDELKRLADMNQSIWLEVTYTGNDFVPDIQSRLNSCTDNTLLEILNLRYEGTQNNITLKADDFTGTSLDDISAEKIFEELMNSAGTPEENREIFRSMYREILQEINTEENEK